jgi:hypothetical protein
MPSHRFPETLFAPYRPKRDIPGELCFWDAQNSSNGLKSLRTQVDRFGRNVDCLIIGHNDPEMIAQLMNSKGDESR